MNNNKIKELEQYVDMKWESIKQIEEVMKYEEMYNGKISKQTKEFKELAIARWATADKILQFMVGAEKHLIEEK